MQDNEDYNVRLARYIWTILTSQPIILMSWGIDPKTVRTIELGLEFHCQGVSLIDENGEIVNTIESVFCDNLVAVIDSAVEKCENYEERISQEYSIITETEK